MEAKKINWRRSIPFISMHFSLLSIFLVPIEWKFVGLCFASYFIRIFGITAGYHRYFSHRSYKTNRIFQFILAWIGSTAVQKGVLWWAANHRQHHRYSDQKEDLHSPVQFGFWWSHIGWIMCDEHDETKWDQIQDLSKFPELRWINKYHLVPVITYAVALFLWQSWGGLIWGFFVSTVILWHGTFTINSLSHLFGKRRFETPDQSRNNVWLALITLGEGWHNNHHCYMSSANQGFYWWEIDISYYVLKALSRVGIVRNLKNPPLAALEAKFLRSDLRSQKTIEFQEERRRYQQLRA